MNWNFKWRPSIFGKFINLNYSNKQSNQGSRTASALTATKAAIAGGFFLNPWLIVLVVIPIISLVVIKHSLPWLAVKDGEPIWAFAQIKLLIKQLQWACPKWILGYKIAKLQHWEYVGEMAYLRDNPN